MPFASSVMISSLSSEISKKSAMRLWSSTRDFTKATKAYGLVDVRYSSDAEIDDARAGFRNQFFLV
jgi:hypothetical protein